MYELTFIYIVCIFHEPYMCINPPVAIVLQDDSNKPVAWLDQNS